MPRWEQPSNVDLVYEVLRSSERPLTVEEIFEAVNQRRPITTQNPKATIRNVLSQGSQLVSTGDGRFGYLPHLLTGSVLRVPLQEKEPANRPLVYPTEALHALWPDFFEIEKRRLRRPIMMRLPNGEEVALPLEFPGAGVWGSSMPEILRRYLIDERASERDSLLVRVAGGDAARCEAWLDHRSKRDEAAVAARNREVADAVYQVLARKGSNETPIWDLAVAALARGLYRSDTAPDTLDALLRADSRFVDMGLEMWIRAEAMTPEFERIRLRRKGKGVGLLAAEEKTDAGPEGFRAAVDIRLASESATKDFHAFFAEQHFKSVDEANAFLEKMRGQGLAPDRELATALDIAQDLMYTAWDTSDPRERVRLAGMALQISPDCADAYVLLANDTARGLKQALELYAMGVAAGERALGKEPFDKLVGHFWGILETRPYMRARFGLAQSLWAIGRWPEAIANAWELLRLNPGDNQGVRYILLNILLGAAEFAQVEKLLGLYLGDGAAGWQYGIALHAFRIEGDTRHSRKLLAEARRDNPHVPDYLLGRKRLPRYLPETVQLGSQDEAIDCASGQKGAWKKTPGALEWLGKSVRLSIVPTRR
ncbi:MAG: hypothetical protein Q8R28_00245 [Dehalococcoidia bacterium]|nr:hypothetical protein [Dehalococcoidia bacterium]